VDQSTGKLLGAGCVSSGAQRGTGQTWNPTLAWLPVGKGAPQGVYRTPGMTLGRASQLLDPSFSEGVLGRLLGARKTVLRGGYAWCSIASTARRTFFFHAKRRLCANPQLSGTAAHRLVSGGQRSGHWLSHWRGRIDSTSVPRAANSLVPAAGYSNVSFALDPNLRPGYANTVNFTVQREIPGLSSGSRLRRTLRAQSHAERTAQPLLPFMKDAASGQTSLRL